MHDNESKPIPRLNLSLIQNMDNYQTMMNIMVLIYNAFTLKPFNYMTPQMSQPTITNNSLLGISYIIYIKKILWKWKSKRWK